MDYISRSILNGMLRIGSLFLAGVTRVEVIDDDGRSYTQWNLKSVEMQIQDEGRTLKLFISKKTNKHD